jgi:DNA-binding response OmpR family regulator/tetratricopeptide (TPR) repeat protein
MSTASILLVEDDPHLGKGISDFLTAKGYAVTWVRDGLAAIHEAHQSRFDLALVDIYLPERDGISVCGVLKDTRRPPPVIAMSAANVHAELREKLDSDLRPDLFLMKPIPLRQLAREIETLLARRRDPEAVTQQPTSNTSGSLALVEALARAVSTGRPGVIEVDALGISTQLYVRNGSIVQAEGGPFSASLWRRLKREEMLSSSQLIDLLQAAQAVYERGLLARPAELVLESGALPVAVVERELIAQVRELTLACFQWENATARFHSGLAHLDTLPLLAPQPIEPLLRAGIQRHWTTARAEAVLASQQGRSYLALPGDRDRLAAQFALSPVEHAYLEDLDTRRPIPQLLDETDPLPRGQRASLFAALTLSGAAELSTAPRVRPPREETGSFTLPAPETPSPLRDQLFREYIRVKGRPDHVVLRLGPSPQADEVVEAFQRLAEPVLPDRLPADLTPRAREWATEIYALLRRSRDHLLAGEPLLRPQEHEVHEQLARVRAEIAFQRGLQHLEREDPARALRHFERAAQLLPSALEYAMHDAWIRIAWAADPVGRASALASARALAESLAAQDHLATDARILLATLARDRGETALAAAYLQDANRLGPQDERVEKLLASLRTRG